MAEILTSLHVPMIHDGAKWVQNPFPLNTVYPLGTTVLIADRRCSFITGDNNAPIPSDAWMTYRLDDSQPFNFLANRSLNWPVEWPCLTPDFHPDPWLNFSVDLGAEAYAFTWTLGKRMCTEYAIWNLDFRTEGKGQREPNSILGRIWPHAEYYQWVSMPNALGQPQAYGSFRYCFILDVEVPAISGVPEPVVEPVVEPTDPGDEQPPPSETPTAQEGWPEPAFPFGPDPLGALVFELARSIQLGNKPSVQECRLALDQVYATYPHLLYSNQFEIVRKYLYDNAAGVIGGFGG